MARRPRWTVVHQLRTKLSKGSLGEDMTGDWAGQDDATQERARKLKADLDSLETAIGVIAEALERPGRSHQALRARPADPQT